MPPVSFFRATARSGQWPSSGKLRCTSAGRSVESRVCARGQRIGAFGGGEMGVNRWRILNRGVGKRTSGTRGALIERRERSFQEVHKARETRMLHKQTTAGNSRTCAVAQPLLMGGPPENMASSTPTKQLPIMKLKSIKNPVLKSALALTACTSLTAFAGSAAVESKKVVKPVEDKPWISSTGSWLRLPLLLPRSLVRGQHDLGRPQPQHPDRGQPHTRPRRSLHQHR